MKFNKTYMALYRAESVLTKRQLAYKTGQVPSQVENDIKRIRSTGRKVKSFTTPSPRGGYALSWKSFVSKLNVVPFDA